ncbi:MAG: MFS transporter [Betaproteobacteria bacterium]|nr:MFS transporter [Betaproteobacteria bacterium]
MLRTVDVRTHEWPALAWSFVYFFCLLCGYYVLRPVRDEMGIAGGIANLPWMFTGTFVAMLAAVPLFGWVTARYPRRVMLPAVYGFFIVNLLLFFLLMKNAAAPAGVAQAFFIWVSVFNLFVVSVFWSFMVDLFTNEQGKRLFGMIAAGGSAGALTGPALTAALAVPLGVPNLLLVSALFLGVAVICIQRLLAWDTQPEARLNVERTSSDAAIGGSIWAGIRSVLGSGYLLGVCLYIVLFSLLFTFLYFEQARIVAASIASGAERTRLFAFIDLAVNLLALLLQVALTGRLLAWLGVAGTLALLPALSVLGFAVLGAFPLLAVIVAFQIVRRAGEYAIAKPARELLFAVLDRERKYKAKNFIDTVVFRGGDAASGWLLAGLKVLGLGVVALAAAAVPVALAWAALSWLLGRRQEALAQKGDAVTQ